MPRVRVKIAIDIRLWNRVDQSAGADGCWPWTGAVTAFGYGRLGDKSKRKTLVTHRVAWEAINGPIPEGLCVLHRCDNPPCCNPTHLFVGTRSDNAKDMMNKGRGTLSQHKFTGERHGRARLTESKVAEMRALFAAGVSVSAIARQFNAARSTVDHVLKNETWANTCNSVAPKVA